MSIVLALVFAGVAGALALRLLFGNRGIGYLFPAQTGPGFDLALGLPSPIIPSDQSVRARAYQLWENGGRMDGNSIDNWLQAERGV